MNRTNLYLKSDGQQEEDRVRDPEIVSSDDVRFPSLDSDLGHNSPPFFRDIPFFSGTTNGNVQFCHPNCYEHVGEPSQGFRVCFVKIRISQDRNKKTDDFRKQTSSIRASLTAITANNQTVVPESVNVIFCPPPFPCASVLSFPKQNADCSRQR